MRNLSLGSLLVGAVLCAVAFGNVEAQLREGYYEHSCPNAEKIVWDYVSSHISKTPATAAPLLRMHFHDCFVRGCDGSVLLDSVGKVKAEKDEEPNESLRGFDFIENIKTLLEKACPGVVSCADIIALVARDAVHTIGGPYWSVPTGRRDGSVSLGDDNEDNIPSPMMNYTTLLKYFNNKGLDEYDLIWLSGAHTIGVADCDAFKKRFNYSGYGDWDPAMDYHYATTLLNKCKYQKENIEMDPGSYKTFDTNYYVHVAKRRGLFHSDAALLYDSVAYKEIHHLATASKEEFFAKFSSSIVKMGKIGVKTGSEGVIRKKCSKADAW